MIKVTSYINNNNKIIGFLCSGHAGYADKGFDIICSAVSVLVINTVNSIDEFTSDIFDYKEDEETGRIDFLIHSNVSDESELLLKSLFLGLQGIQDSYGKKHIKFNKKRFVDFNIRSGGVYNVKNEPSIFRIKKGCWFFKEW